MKKLSIVLIALATLTLAGCSAPAPSQQGSSATEAVKTPTVGSTLTDAYGVAVTLTSVRTVPKNDLGSAPSNGSYLVVGFSVTNGSTDDVNISSLMSFELASESGQRGDIEIFVKGKGSMDGTVKPGRKLAGEVTFNVASDAKYFVSFKPGLMSEPMEFEFAKDQIQ